MTGAGPAAADKMSSGKNTGSRMLNRMEYLIV